MLHAACFYAVFCVGLYATSFGPALPFFAGKLDVSLDTAGFLITGIFVGSIVASGLVTIGLARGKMRLAVTVGLVLGALGLGLLGLATNWWAALAATVLLGFGDGLIVAGGHVLIADTAEDVPAGITRLNLWFAVGAILGPLWAGAILANEQPLAVVYVGLALTLFAGITLLSFARRTPERRPGILSGSQGPPLSVFFAVMGVLLLLYVGAEIGLGSWVSSYAERTADAGIMVAATITAGYWGALALGRMLAEGLFRRGWTAPAVLRWSIAGGIVASSALVLLGGNVWLGAGAAFATGLCFGPVWPATMAAALGEDHSVPAAMVTLGNAGGVVLPWAQGVLLVSQGARAGVALTVALCTLMLALALLATRLRPAEPPLAGM
jgi:fucose permease